MPPPIKENLILSRKEKERVTTKTEVTKIENLMWEKTNDKIGLRESQPIYCPMCTARALVQGTPTDKVTRMVMRRSRIHNVADVRIFNQETKPSEPQKRPYAMDIAFKCPVCDYYCIFGIPIDIDYAQKVIEMRGGTVDFVLPEETWGKNSEVEKKLERWGYW